MLTASVLKKLYWAKYFVAAVAVTLLFSFSGCRERPEVSIVEPPPKVVSRDFWVRVLLSNDVKKTTVLMPSSYSIVEPQTNAIVARGGSNSHLSITVSQTKLIINGRVLESRQIKLVPDQPFIFYTDSKAYRGELRISLNADLASFDLINYVPLESYLAGVVGAEMPSYWEPEALKAQAITSRTYCLYIKERFGPNRAWDVNRTQSNQVYLGIEAESPKVWQAVNQTKGQVLECASDSGRQNIFPAYFSSVCGGQTENSKKVFGDSFGPLRGVPCPYCKQTANKDMFYWPMVQFDKKTVNAQLVAKYPSLAKLGQITDISILDRTQMVAGFSRANTFKLVGSNGLSDMVRAEDLRLAIDPTGRKLRSTICQVGGVGNNWAFYSGRGFGHGVGFCQYGAEGMARKGSSMQNILSYYFPSSITTKLY